MPSPGYYPLPLQQYLYSSDILHQKCRYNAAVIDSHKQAQLCTCSPSLHAEHFLCNNASTLSPVGHTFSDGCVIFCRVPVDGSAKKLSSSTEHHTTRWSYFAYHILRVIHFDNITTHENRVSFDMKCTLSNPMYADDSAVSGRSNVCEGVKVSEKPSQRSKLFHPCPSHGSADVMRSKQPGKHAPVDRVNSGLIGFKFARILNSINVIRSTE